MKFLDTFATEAAVRELLAQDGSTKAAVAYWDRDAIKRLEIKRCHDLTVVCDLLSGSCNPDEIRKLQDTIGANRVLTRDRLHAKIWLANHVAVLGSSNASANGLGFEGCEATALVEANIVMDEPRIIAAISRWWDEKVFLGARIITEKDLRLAKRRWKRHRVGRPMPEYADLLAGLRAEPEAFRDRDLFVWVWQHETLDPWAEDAIEQARERLKGDKLDCWQDVDQPPPPGSYVIDFNSESDPPEFEGMWRILVDQPIYEPARKQGKLLLCTSVTTFDGLKLGNLQAWRRAAAAAAKTDNDEWTASDFAKFLRD